MLAFLHKATDGRSNIEMKGKDKHYKEKLHVHCCIGEAGPVRTQAANMETHRSVHRSTEP